MKPIIIKTDRVKQSKTRSSAHVGSVKPGQVIVPKKQKPPKYKPDFTSAECE